MKMVRQLLWLLVRLRPLENTPLDPTGDDMDDDLLEEMNPPATKRRGEFGAIQVPYYNAGVPAMDCLFGP